MKFAWLTDIHLNFLDESQREKFYQDILNTLCDGVFISGDIAEAISFAQILQEMSSFLKKPIYFVLGNHDYYGGNVNQVQEIAKALSNKNDYLFWLPALKWQALDPGTFILGQDGWADARLGDYQHSKVVLNDSRLITDLFQAKLLGKYKLQEKMMELADIDAAKLNNAFNGILEFQPKKVIILSHVPPFKEACKYLGQFTDDDWLPFFSSKTMGDVLLKIAKANPFISFLVLCGHTHDPAYYQALDNLVVKVGQSEYFYPRIQELIIV